MKRQNLLGYLLILLISANNTFASEPASSNSTGSTNQESLNGTAIKGQTVVHIHNAQIHLPAQKIDTTSETNEIWNMDQPKIQDIKILQRSNNIGFLRKLMLFRDKKLDGLGSDVKCNLPNMSAWIPYDLYLLIKEYQDFLKDQFNEDKNKLFINRLLLYGPPGNGKTLLAEKVAEISDCNLLKINGPAVITGIVGGGVDSINKYFNKIQKFLDIHACKGIICLIEEIDAFTKKNNSTDAASSSKQDALQHFWLKLDEFEKYNRVFIIGTTNSFKDLNATMVDRFGENTISICNPNENMRKDIIVFFLEYFKIELHQKLVTILTKKTDGLGIRSIKSCLRKSKRIANAEFNGIVSEQIITSVVTSLKANKAEDGSNNTQASPSRSTLEKARDGSIIFGTIAGAMAAIVKVYYEVKNLKLDIAAKKAAQVGAQILSKL